MRRAAGPFLVLSVPAVLATDTLAALTSGWRPTGTIEWAGCVLIALAMGAALYMLARHRAALRRASGDAVLLVLSSVLAVALLEAGAGYLDARLRPEARFFHTRGPQLQQTFQPDPRYIAGITGPSQYTTRANGLRAPEAPPRDALRVLFIGGSTTECTYLDDTETWAWGAAGATARALDRRVWAGIAAVSGFDTRDHVQFIANSPLVRQADALVVQTGVNDLWRSLAGERDQIDFDRFAPAPRRAADPPAVSRREHRPWWTRANTIQLWHTLRRPAPDPAQVEGDAGAEYAVRRARRAEAERVRQVPLERVGTESYAARVQALAEAARRRGVPLLLVGQPVLWAGDLSPRIEARCWFGWLEDGRYLALAALRRYMEEYNEVLRGGAIAHGARYVDVANMHGQPGLFYDDCHFTELGAQVLAAQVAPVLTGVLGGEAEPRD